MSTFTRRGFMAAGCASVAACGELQVQSGSQIDRKVAASREELFQFLPAARGLAEMSAGMLIIPEVVEASFFFGAGYGEGALLVGNAAVEYISVTAATVGLKFGGQSFSQALFFVTPEALRDFRVTDGWELGVDAEAAILDEGVSFGASSRTVNRPVYEVIYGQRGLILGASLDGAKYSRLVR